jgi:serine O-acetyltransferase
VSGGRENACVRRGHRRFATLRAELGRDVDRLLRHVHGDAVDVSGRRRRWGAVLTPQLLALVLHRVAHCLHANNRRHAASIVARLNFLLHKVDIDPSSCIAGGCLLPHPPGVSFLGSARRDLTLYSLCACVADPEQLDAGGPEVGERVMIGGHAVLVGAIRVGDDVKIAPNARVDRDVPPNSLVVSRNMRVASVRPLHASTPTAAAAGIASTGVSSRDPTDEPLRSSVRSASDT